MAKVAESRIQPRVINFHQAKFQGLNTSYKIKSVNNMINRYQVRTNNTEEELLAQFLFIPFPGVK
jgi:hypothetical protein